MNRPRRDARPWLYADYGPTVLKALFTQKATDALLQDKRLFFVLSTGRCGTVLLADLLGQAEGATVLHEPVWLDYVALKGAYQSPRKAMAYISRYRRKKIHDLVQSDPDIHTYGETSFMLSFFAEALKTVAPNLQLLHLVRDGRDVVRSLINRGYYHPDTMADDMQYRSITPLPDSPYYERWDHMNQFERCCWRWMVTNAIIMRSASQVARFEEIMTDYDAFQEQMAGPLGLATIDVATWEGAVKVKRNPSARILFPHWREWTAEQNAAFREIAGDVMEKVGYDVGQ